MPEARLPHWTGNFPGFVRFFVENEMPIFPIQPSFTGGELAPGLAARVDLAKYHVGAKTMKNFICHAHGGVSNRAGTKLVCEALSNDAPSRLIEFMFSTIQAYILEFGGGKIRVIKDHGLVVYPSGHASEGQVVEITSPYLEAELSMIRFVQSADVIYLAHENHTQIGRASCRERVFRAV